MAPHCASLSSPAHEYRQPPPLGTPASSLLIDAALLVMMGEEEEGGGLPLSPPVVSSRCGGLSTEPPSVYCAAHFFPFVLVQKRKRKKNGCSVLHALADLHSAPTLSAPQYKSGLRRIAAHRLRAPHCDWIIQELAERKRRREWGVSTLSPGETGAKEEASLDE